ncbi:hypothetical protein [Gordonia effusa]|uniref:hypothetical protein n=1 Tax=Gordonia effusa TaxID=263908 RepID=UPI001FE1C0F5|nr:hypothetical protein [Gordonia effusa]
MGDELLTLSAELEDINSRLKWLGSRVVAQIAEDGRSVTFFFHPPADAPVASFMYAGRAMDIRALGVRDQDGRNQYVVNEGAGVVGVVGLAGDSPTDDDLIAAATALLGAGFGWRDRRHLDDRFREPFAARASLSRLNRDDAMRIWGDSLDSGDEA